MPGLVSTLFHHMYSAPVRSVQMFLQATLQVWQPMHLSRWKTIETCARISISCPSSTSRAAPACARSHVGVAVGAGGAPVVEEIGELGVAARQLHRIDPQRA